MWDVCRCCLVADGCSRDIFSEYLIAGRPEVCDIMLRETFNIEMSHEESDTRGNTLICERCVSRLQEASAFRAVVLRSEQVFAQFLKDSKSKCDNLEMIKQEDSGVNSDDGRCSPEDSNFLKAEMNVIPIETKDTTVMKQNRDSASNKHVKSERKVKKKSNSCNIKSNIDYAKLTELRGSGPVLRENSLKLLENSTIFAFQWHRSKYTCFCCQKPFLNTDELRQHALEHTMKDVEKKIIAQQNMRVKVDISVLDCKLCCKALRDLQELRDHLTTDHNFEFQMKDDLLVPFKIKDGLRCLLCGEQFSVFRMLNMHMNRHYPRHVCHVCGAPFASLKFLNLHVYRSHRQWKCKECGVEFATKVDKRKHDANIHKKKRTKLRCPCPHCDERYPEESSRILHLVEKHGMTKPEYKCSVCSKSFVTRGLCNYHFKAVHKKERKHPCEECSKLFYSRSDAARHRRSHARAAPRACAACGALFASTDSLRRHVKRTHAGG